MRRRAALLARLSRPASALALGLLPGCLLVDSRVELTYEPSPPGAVAPREASSGPRAEALPPITLARFADDREAGGGPTGRRVGEVRNFMDLRVAELVTRDDPTVWVTDALALELENAGFEVRRTEALVRPAPNTQVGLTGRVHRIDSSPKKDWDAEVEVRAELWVGDRRVLYRRYLGLAEAVPGDDEPIEGAFARALRNALVQLVADLDRTLAPR